MTRIRIATKTIDDLVERTREGYSFDRYTIRGWRAAIRWLLKQGWSDDQVEWFMLSKHTRWAGDYAGGDYGALNERTIQRYLADARNRRNAQRHLDLEAGLRHGMTTMTGPWAQV